MLVINFPLGGGGIKFYSGIDEHLHFNPSQQPFDDNLNKFTDWRVNGHTGIRKCSKSDRGVIPDWNYAEAGN